MQISDLPCPVPGKEDREMKTKRLIDRFNLIQPLVAKFGLPRVIIVSFFLFLVAGAGFFI